MTKRGFDAMESRKIRISRTREILRKLKKTRYKKARAVISLELGITEIKASEYIELLKDLGELEDNNGLLVFVGESSSKAAAEADRVLKNLEVKV